MKTKEEKIISNKETRKTKVFAKDYYNNNIETNFQKKITKKKHIDF